MPEREIPLGLIPLHARPQFLSTFWRGVRAYQAGKPLTECPYRADDAGFATTYKGYWDRGWKAAEASDA